MTTAFHHSAVTTAFKHSAVTTAFNHSAVTTAVLSTARAPAPRQDVRKVLKTAGLSDCPSLPWDVRGPPGPSDGGPRTHKKQKYRDGSQRWANSGGQHHEKFALYYRKKREGATGADLAFFHPYARGGHW